MVLCSKDGTHKSMLYCFSPFRTLASTNSLLVLLLTTVNQTYSKDLVVLIDMFIVSQNIQMFAGRVKRVGSSNGTCLQSNSLPFSLPPRLFIFTKALYLLAWVYQSGAGSANYGIMNNNAVLEHGKPWIIRRGFQPRLHHELKWEAMDNSLNFYSLSILN